MAISSYRYILFFQYLYPDASVYNLYPEGEQDFTFRIAGNGGEHVLINSPVTNLVSGFSSKQSISAL